MSESSTVGAGTVLADRYELTDIIGRGGFGTVWKARQINMDRDVAIKVLPPQFLTLKDVVERFKREAKLASRLRHPNTITLHDYGQHDNLLYIVMELLSGEDLADVLKREGRLPPERIMHIAKQVLKSLAEAHEQKIVHRDLKPENIFLSVVGDDRDHVKVVDFGIAKLLQPTAEDAVEAGTGRRLTLSGSTVGTPTYMSPEQAAGEDVDGLTDLYALGIIMYEAVNGRPPFHNKDPVKVMRSQLFDEVPPLRDPRLRGTLLDRVIQKALQKEPADRFASAAQMLLALAGEPVARPLISGVSLDALDAPATLDLAEETGPNTDDYRTPETLSFAQGIKQPRTIDDDPIPFGVVDAHADTMIPSGTSDRRKSKRRTEQQIDVAGQSVPPGGFTVPEEESPRRTRTRSKAERAKKAVKAAAKKASIVTVIEEAPEDSSEQVILLTRKKTPGVQTAISSDPVELKAIKQEASEDIADVAAEADEEPTAAPDAIEPASEGDEDTWAWSGTDDVPADGAPAPIPRKDGIGLWIVVLFALAAIAAAGFYL